MQNPEKELKDYLKRLVYNFIYLKSLLSQINLFLEWRKNNGDEGIKEGYHFYSLVFYSFKRVIVLETYKLLSKREQRSLYDWLAKAKDHTDSLKPNRYARPSIREPLQRIDLTKKEYKKIVDEHLQAIIKYEPLIDKLESLRDKNFAHSDKQYFDNPDKVEIEFPVSWKELNELFDCIAIILRKQHSLVFESDISMELSSAYDIDSVLKLTRAFDRIWKNKRLNEIGLKKYIFKSDDYNPDDIFLKQ